MPELKLSYEERLLNKFKLKTEPFWELYKSVEINALLINEDGQWKINTCTIALSPFLVPTRNIKWVMKTEHFILVEESKNIETFEEIYTSALDGIIEINNKRYEIFDREAKKNIRMSDNMVDSDSFYGPGTRCYSIIIEPQPSMNRIMGDLYEDFQESLKSNVPPFVNMHELEQGFFIMGNQYGITHGLPIIMIHVPFLLSINTERTKFQNDGLHIEIDFIKGLDKSKIQLNYVFHTIDVGYSRGVFPDLFTESSPSPSIVHLETTIDWDRLRFQILKCDLLLVYNGQFFFETSLFNPYYKSDNIGICTLNILFKDFEDIFKNLFIGKKSNEFENTIAILFGFCNFKVIPLGEISRFTDAPDIIALDIYNQVGIIIEASTLEFLDKEKKLTKFITRCEILKKHLTDIEIIPVFCTSLEGSKLVKPEIDEAKKHNIIILSREDLVDLYELAKKNVPNEDIIQYINSRSLTDNTWTSFSSIQ